MYEKQFLFFFNNEKDEKKIDQGWLAPTIKAIFGNQFSPTVHPLDQLEVRLFLSMHQLTEKQKESSIKEAPKITRFIINIT